MRTMGLRILGGVVMAALVSLVVLRAQAPPAAAAPPKASAPAVQPPQLPADVVKALDEKREIAKGYVRAINALQKELDAANADLGRAVDQVQRAYPGYELSADPWTLKKVEASKKETMNPPVK